MVVRKKAIAKGHVSSKHAPLQKSLAQLEDEKRTAKLGNTPMAWHHSICNVTGSMSLRIELRKTSVQEIEHWIECLQLTIGHMKEFVKKAQEKK